MQRASAVRSTSCSRRRCLPYAICVDRLTLSHKLTADSALEGLHRPMVAACCAIHQYTARCNVLKVLDEKPSARARGGTARAPMCLRALQSETATDVGSPTAGTAAMDVSSTPSEITMASVSSTATARPGSSSSPPPPPPPPPSERDEVSAADWEQEIDELFKLTALLPPAVRAALEQHSEQLELLEVVMDLGRPPLARFPSGDFRLSEQAVALEDLEHAVKLVGSFGGDNRAGVDRTLHRVSCMRNRSGKVVGLTCRVGRAIRGSAKMVEDLILSGASVLLLGRPGVGKTTAIREVARMLAGDLQKRVVIVDTSNEIGGDGDIPHEGIGRARRMQVPNPDEQHKIMIEAVENHMPQVIVIDEIGTEAEALAARTIAQRGVQLVATAHGNELENLIKNPSLADLVGGIQSVTLGDEEARRRGVQKSVLERAAPPTFDVAIEMLERSKWRVHVDVGAAVDIILAGRQAGGQVRERAVDGSILRYNYKPAAPSSLPSQGGLPTTRALDSRSDVPQAERPAFRVPEEGRGSASATKGRSSTAASGAALPADQLKRPVRPSAGRGGGYPPLSATSSFVRDPLASHPEEDAEGSPAGIRRDNGSGHSSFGGGGAIAAYVADADTAVLSVYPYGLDDDRLWEVMQGMQLTGKVHIANKVEKADAVLAVRPKLRANTQLRAAAKAAGVPVYAVKNSSSSSLVRAFRTLLGVDPAAGGGFARGSGDEDDVSLRVGSDPSNSDSDDPASLRAEVDIALVSSCKVNAGRPYARAGSENEALDEAQMAVEQIVLPLSQPVELLPRTSEVRAVQVQLLLRYQLGHEVVGQGQDARLRVLPRAAGWENKAA